MPPMKPAAEKSEEAEERVQVAGPPRELQSRDSPEDPLTGEKS